MYEHVTAQAQVGAHPGLQPRLSTGSTSPQPVTQAPGVTGQPERDKQVQLVSPEKGGRGHASHGNKAATMPLPPTPSPTKRSFEPAADLESTLEGIKAAHVWQTAMADESARAAALQATTHAPTRDGAAGLQQKAALQGAGAAPGTSPNAGRNMRRRLNSHAGDSVSRITPLLGVTEGTQSKRPTHPSPAKNASGGELHKGYLQPSSRPSNPPHHRCIHQTQTGSTRLQNANTAMLDVDAYDTFATATAAADHDAADVSSACLGYANVDCTDEHHHDGNAAGCPLANLLPSLPISQSSAPDNVSPASPDAAPSQKPCAHYGGTHLGPDQQQRKAASAEGLAAVQPPQPAQVPNPIGLSLSEPRHRRRDHQHLDRAAHEQQAGDILSRINHLAELYNTAAESVCGFAALSTYNRFLIQQWRHVAHQYALDKELERVLLRQAEHLELLYMFEVARMKLADVSTQQQWNAVMHDLHGMDEDFARAWVKYILRRYGNLSHLKATYVMLIVGTGNNSLNHEPKLAPAITKLLRAFGLTVMFVGHKPGVLIVCLDGPVHYTEYPEGQEPPLTMPIPSLPSKLCVRFPGFHEDSDHLPEAAVAQVRQCIEDMAQAFKSMAQTQKALGRCLY
ncbi:TPA: hypothetical protein ACH3X1_001366 [Trebouxia sp. C0004]